MLFRLFLLLILLSIPHVSMAQVWPDDTIGAGIGVAAKPERTGSDELERIKEAGFSFIRYDMRWSEVEHRRGVYDWSAFDKFITNMRTHHLKSIIILDNPNELYGDKVSVPPEQSFGYSWGFAAPHTDEARKAFSAFAAAAVKRYGTGDIIWEIWNEPDAVAFWPPKPNPENFVQLADITCHAMRKVAPHAIIIGPAIARLPSRIDFLHEHFFEVFIQSPVKNCLDAISVHPYRSHKIPETVISDYKDKVRPFITAYTDKDKKPLPVVDSEWGYSSTDVNPEQQAAYLLRMHLSNLLAGVPISIIYEWKDSSNMSDDREMHFGMLDADKRNKAGADIVDELLPKIKDAKIIGRLPVREQDAYVVQIRQPDGSNQLLAWMALAELGNDWALNFQEEGGLRSYPLSLIPQLINIGSSLPEFAVTKDGQPLP